MAKKYHKNVILYSTGLYINAKYPHLGASPDDIIVCDCHGKGYLEIKWPHKYHNSQKGWRYDKDFPRDESGQIKKDHMYYAYVEGQLLILS